MPTFHFYKNGEKVSFGAWCDIIYVIIQPLYCPKSDVEIGYVELSLYRQQKHGFYTKYNDFCTTYNDSYTKYNEFYINYIEMVV